MSKENLNFCLQILFFPGICIIGLSLAFLTKSIKLMPFFFAISVFLRLIMSITGKIYGKSHWFSRKECNLDAIIFIIIGFIGELEIVLYIY